MSKVEQEMLQQQLTDVWRLVGELEAISIRLRAAADAALEALEARKKKA